MPDYLPAVIAHVNECWEDLDQLAQIGARRPFTRMERRAAERALQVLIEACIGIAKYWLKAEQKHLPLDAYESFNKLAELQKISLADLKQWRKVVGMRNALVHDYLTIDNELLHAVIADGSYQFLLDFVSTAQQQLAS